MTSFFNPATIQYAVPPDPKAVLVIIHGMAEHSARYASLIDFLHAHAIVVCRFDLRGHGASPPSEQERGDVVAFQDFVVDAAVVIDGARARYPALPVFVWGHSMGAIVATLSAAHMALQGPMKIRGVITSSAPVAAFDAVPKFVLRLLTGLSVVAPRLRVKRPFKPARLSRDLQVGEAYGNDPLVPKAITLRLLVQLAAASLRCVQTARKLKLPWFAMHGTDDEIAPAIGSQRLIDALGSADKQLRVWPGARHEVHNEIEPTRTDFLECMVAWIKERT
jgi:acylglycerol lipase